MVKNSLPNIFGSKTQRSQPASPPNCGFLGSFYLEQFISVISHPMNFKFRAESKSTNPNPNNDSGKRQSIDLGNGSDLIYIPRFLSFEESRNWFDYLNKEIPWTRPTIRVFGRSCVQVGFSSYLENFLETEQQYV